MIISNHEWYSTDSTVNYDSVLRVRVLKDGLDSLVFDDLGSFDEPSVNGSTSVGSVSQESLDELGEALEGLELRAHSNHLHAYMHDRAISS